MELEWNLPHVIVIYRFSWLEGRHWCSVFLNDVDESFCKSPIDTGRH